jgi:hypothetical protein
VAARDDGAAPRWRGEEAAAILLRTARGRRRSKAKAVSLRAGAEAGGGRRWMKRRRRVPENEPNLEMKTERK